MKKYQYLKAGVVVLLFILLIYTRMVNLGWGLPYPMHPDERNMALAIQNLRIENSFNPDFFAYGQLPLYFSYIGIQLFHIITGRLNLPINFIEATLALRATSAIASIINAFVLIKILMLIIDNLKIKFMNYKFLIVNLPVIIASSYFIQYSHFGTTESYLMLFYSLIVYLSMNLIKTGNTKSITVIPLALITGLSLATKLTSSLFLAVPFFAIIYALKHQDQKSTAGTLFFRLLQYVLYTALIFLMFSPHTLLSYSDFITTINYESLIAKGAVIPFYTRQFIDTVPFVFQFIKVFPYVLGWPMLILGIIGFLGLSWKNKYYNLLRFAFLVYLIPNAVLFAKWTRFMAPIFPLITIFGLLIINKIKILNAVKIAVLTIAIIPGLSYLTIYQYQDVRFQASDWIYENIPNNKNILTEQGNVIDLPLLSGKSNQLPKNYQITSFDFYNLDENINLQKQLIELVKNTDYIIVPSRRVFANHTCQHQISPLRLAYGGFRGASKVQSDSEKLKNTANESRCRKLSDTYPLLNQYYSRLFSEELEFKLVAEFSSYPKIEIFGQKIIEFPDEMAEETWTVFDHPVVRIYERQYQISPLRRESSGLRGASKFQSNKPIISNELFKNYKTTEYLILNTEYLLLIADTPDKWQAGLMRYTKHDLKGVDGMLFKFPDKETRTFWNQNTLVDLDLYWLVDNRLIKKDKLPAINQVNELVIIDSPQPVNRVIELIQ